MDFTRLAKAVDAYRRTRGYVLPEWYLHAKQFATLQCRVPGSPSGPALAFISQSDSNQAVAAAELLGKSVQQVVAAPDRPEFAEQYRAAIIRMLCAAKRP